MLELAPLLLLLIPLRDRNAGRQAKALGCLQWHE